MGLNRWPRLQASVCSGTFLVLLLLPFWLLPKGLCWLIAALLLLPMIPLLESLLLTPIYCLSGRFVYYSKTLFVTRAVSGLQLHAGTLYDYLALLHWHEYGPKAQRKLTVQLLQGLLALCDDIAKGNIAPSTRISGTSYFFSNRSAAKFGFGIAPVPVTERLNLLIAIFSLALRLSISRGRLSCPNLKQMRHIQTTASDLLAQRPTLIRLLKHLTMEHKRLA